ncbi:hypothetical protein [Flaviaesturariibacter amylovorans]|uniref:DUF4440 domain-containing protein n=1 Tax=Flaviaesturariibacter amylovorans TaxID=1084520 RepID=A0ABP8G4V6_9BACT
MIRIITILSFALLLLPLRGGAQPLPTRIKVQAMELATAVMQNDFAAFARRAHPNVIAFGGGAERVRTKMDSAHQKMKRMGAGFTRYSIGSPAPIVTHGKELQTLVPQSTTVRTPLGLMTVESTLVAISRNEGKDWMFLDTGVYGPRRLQEVLPDLSPQLVLPPRKKPRLEPFDK